MVFAQTSDEFIPTEPTNTGALNPSFGTSSPPNELIEIPSFASENAIIPGNQDVNQLDQIIENQRSLVITPFNVIRYFIGVAVTRGISVNTIVFLLLFPLIALIIAISRHIIGLTGLSVYAPAALALALLSIGVTQGTALFVATIIFATVAKTLLSAVKLQYMPRTALMLWFVSLGIFGFVVLSTYIPFLSFTTVNVFALLIVILLSENFLEIQSQRTRLVAIQRAFETYALALICALLLGSQLVQAAVLLYPEMVLPLIAFSNLLVGKYLGLRFTEWLRFRPIMEHEE